MARFLDAGFSFWGLQTACFTSLPLREWLLLPSCYCAEPLESIEFSSRVIARAQSGWMTSDQASPGLRPWMETRAVPRILRGVPLRRDRPRALARCQRDSPGQISIDRCPQGFRRELPGSPGDACCDSFCRVCGASPTLGS